MAQTKIEWCDTVWNPVTGCTPVSEGCQNCYAQRMAQRLKGRFGYPEDKPFRVTLHPERLDEPLRWKKPRRVFVNSMGDLYHENVSDDWLLAVFVAMGLTYEHTGKMKKISHSYYEGIFQAKHIFLHLTKRPKRMKEFIMRLIAGEIDQKRVEYYNSALAARNGAVFPGNFVADFVFEKWLKDGMPGLWLGVTAENQKTADERIPILLEIPAAVRFVSCEPLLGAINLKLMTKAYHKWRENRESRYDKGIHWIICGGETGLGARPMHPDWVRRLRDQCQAAGTPFYFKAWGEWSPIEVMNDPTAPHILLAYNGKQTQEYCGWGCDNPTARFAQMVRVGKKKAGRLLDGRKWDEVPEGVITCPKATAKNTNVI